MYQDDESLFGIHGKKQVWSLDMPCHGYGGTVFTFGDLVNKVLAEQEGHEHIEVKKIFAKFILQNYKTLLSPKQVEYLEMSDENRLRLVKKNARWNYRKRIQHKVTTAYFGHPIKYSRRLETYLDGIVTATMLLLCREDPKDFSAYVVENLDSNYINKLVYEVLPMDMQKETVRAYRDHSYVLKDFTINTICEYAEDDIKVFEKKLKR